MPEEYFGDADSDELGNCVYRLIDPRDGETIYVGNGKRYRVFDHVNATPTMESDEGATSEKISGIREISRSSLTVVHLIHRHGIPEKAILN